MKIMQQYSKKMITLFFSQRKRTSCGLLDYYWYAFRFEFQQLIIH